MTTTHREAKGWPGDEDYEPGDSYQDADSLLGPPVPSVSFPAIGAAIDGTIIDVATGDQRDPNGDVRRFANGEVRRQVILTLDTKLRDDEDDDGRRRLFVKGQMMKAFREAIKKADAPGPRPGGRVKVTYSADGDQATPGLSKPKVFTVTYKAPAA